jgi:hypothetical protein
MKGKRGMDLGDLGRVKARGLEPLNLHLHSSNVARFTRFTASTRPFPRSAIRHFAEARARLSGALVNPNRPLFLSANLKISRDLRAVEHSQKDRKDGVDDMFALAG